MSRLAGRSNNIKNEEAEVPGENKQVDEVASGLVEETHVYSRSRMCSWKFGSKRENLC